MVGVETLRYGEGRQCHSIACSSCGSRNEIRSRLWRWSRTTAWRYVKAVMVAADITGTPAMPKGLRHGFGVNAFQYDRTRGARTCCADVG